MRGFRGGKLPKSGEKDFLAAREGIEPPIEFFGGRFANDLTRPKRDVEPRRDFLIKTGLQASSSEKMSISEDD
jgi:hypothetical protein